jgi:hypothetical protein
MFVGGRGVEQAVEKWTALRGRVRDLGRPVDEFGADYLIATGATGVADLPAQVDAWREAGGTHVSVVTMGLGLDSIDAHIDYIASVAAALSSR